jgi:hypothetical protein
MRFLTAVLAYGVAGAVGALAARSTHVPAPPFRWSNLRGPWFDNNLATADVTDTALELWWARGDVRKGFLRRRQRELPRLTKVAGVHIDNP